MKASIKLNSLLISGLLGINTLVAQNDVSIVQLTDEAFDPIRKWRPYGGHLDDNGNIVLIVGMPYCDVDKSVSYNPLDATITKTWEFKGVAYDFKELTLDKQTFKVINVKNLHFNTTKEAISYQKNLFGKFFTVTNGEIEARPGVAIKIFVGAFTEGVPELNSFYTSEFINTIVVAPSQVASIGKPKVLITANAIVTKVSGNVDRVERASCSEYPVYYMIKKENTREEKGQTWVNIGNVDYPNGGMVGYATLGVVPENGKANIIFKKYDAELNELAREQVDFDFFPILDIVRAKNKSGNYDFVVIAQATDKNFPSPHFKKNCPKGKSSDFEILYLDGNTLKPTYREKLNITFSRWQNIRAYTDESNGATYIFAETGEDNKSYLNYWNKNKDIYNFAILKIKDGKLVWKTEINSKNEGENMIVLKSDEIKGKLSKEAKIFSPKTAEDVLVYNGKVFIKGQVPNSNLYLAVFDDQTGQMTHYFAKPEKILGESDVFFTKDPDMILWSTYDFKEYNDYDSKTGVITPNKKNFPVMGDIYLARINLKEKTAPAIKKLGDGEWACVKNDRIIFDDPNSDEVILLGNTLGRRIKKTDPVLIRIKK